MKSLSFRLLLFNILLLFLPMGSLLYLDTFESQLLVSQEASMVQQGRLLGSALSALDASRLEEEALRILRNLDERVDARIRVVDVNGNLLADSATVIPEKVSEPAVSYSSSSEIKAESILKMLPEGAESEGQGSSPVPAANTRLLYRIVVYPINILRRLFIPPSNYSTAEFYSGQQVLLGPEIKSALEGRYGSTTRYSTGGQVSVTLYSAIPVFAENSASVLGAVLVSRSSYGILNNLYRLRLDIIKIFCVSLLVSLCLSLLHSLTITHPLKKLKAEAEHILDNSGKLSGHFRRLKRKDEIGDLSRSLAALSEKLEKRSLFTETFVSDLYHELKNPLTAIRGQAELLLASPGREENLLTGIMNEEQRMERLLVKLRELSSADSGAEKEKREIINLPDFIPLLINRYARTENGLTLVFASKAGDNAQVLINGDALTQALTNPIDNAVSFSPAGGKISIILEVESSGNFLSITIDDEGPGICEEVSSRYFDRFYSERTSDEKSDYSGLGLAIVKAICENEGGNASLENRPGGGCRFTLRLKKHTARE